MSIGMSEFVHLEDDPELVHVVVDELVVGRQILFDLHDRHGRLMLANGQEIESHRHLHKMKEMGIYARHEAARELVQTLPMMKRYFLAESNMGVLESASKIVTSLLRDEFSNRDVFTVFDRATIMASNLYRDLLEAHADASEHSEAAKTEYSSISHHDFGTNGNKDTLLIDDRPPVTLQDRVSERLWQCAQLITIGARRFDQEFQALALWTHCCAAQASQPFMSRHGLAATLSSFIAAKVASSTPSPSNLPTQDDPPPKSDQPLDAQSQHALCAALIGLCARLSALRPIQEHIRDQYRDSPLDATSMALRVAKAHTLIIGTLRGCLIQLVNQHGQADLSPLAGIEFEATEQFPTYLSLQPNTQTPAKHSAEYAQNLGLLCEGCAHITQSMGDGATFNEALRSLLARSNDQPSQDAARQILRALGPFPVGCTVELISGDVGVCLSHHTSLAQPVVLKTMVNNGHGGLVGASNHQLRDTREAEHRIFRAVAGQGIPATPNFDKTFKALRQHRADPAQSQTAVGDKKTSAATGSHRPSHHSQPRRLQDILI